jgi:hypothetical protein
LLFFYDTLRKANCFRIFLLNNLHKSQLHYFSFVYFLDVISLLCVNDLPQGKVFYPFLTLYLNEGLSFFYKVLQPDCCRNMIKLLQNWLNAIPGTKESKPGSKEILISKKSWGCIWVRVVCYSVRGRWDGETEKAFSMWKFLLRRALWLIVPVK